MRITSNYLRKKSTDLFQHLIKHSEKTRDPPPIPNICHGYGDEHFKSKCFFLSRTKNATNVIVLETLLLIVNTKKKKKKK